MKVLRDFLKIYSARLLAGLLGYLPAKVLAAALLSVLGYWKWWLDDSWWWSAWELWFLLLGQAIYSLISGLLFWAFDALWAMLVGNLAVGYIRRWVQMFLIMFSLDMTRFFIEHGHWLVRREGIAGPLGVSWATAIFVGELLTAALFVFFYFRTTRYVYTSLCICLVLYLLLIFVGL
jgi:hypothetical protein